MITALLPLWLGEFYLHVVTIGLFYVILAISWNLLAGYAGQLSLAHHAFVAVGGYASALLILFGSEAFGSPLPLWGTIVFGTLVAGLVGYGLGSVCLNMRRIYLAVTTWAFAESFRLWVLSEYEITRGDLGLSTELLFDTSDPTPFFYVFLVATVLCLWIVFEIIRSPAGFYLRALRDDEEAAQAMGVDTVRWKRFAFTASSAIAGFAGTLQAHYIGMLTPTPIKFNEMAIIMVMVIAGGLRSFWGPVIGAMFIQVVSEALRDYAEYRMVLFALLVLAIMRFYKEGLFGLMREGVTRLRSQLLRGST
ncbi:MAG: branched-chain amino acid ABC transporter permease [SAR324 cluster bacterium]|nr:branched-chain amino acid ABC transporter permease [SAR324 cluster bacterium]